jgi:hypothetical protein
MEQGGAVLWRAGLASAISVTTTLLLRTTDGMCNGLLCMMDRADSLHDPPVCCYRSHRTQKRPNRSLIADNRWCDENAEPK